MLWPVGGLLGQMEGLWEAWTHSMVLDLLQLCPRKRLRRGILWEPGPEAEPGDGGSRHCWYIIKEHLGHYPDP